MPDQPPNDTDGPAIAVSYCFAHLGEHEAPILVVGLTTEGTKMLGAGQNVSKDLSAAGLELRVVVLGGATMPEVKATMRTLVADAINAADAAETARQAPEGKIH